MKKWGEQILAEVTEELQSFYPKEPDGSDVYAYIWARTVPCQNVKCDVEIPLIKKLWLVNKKEKEGKEKKISIFPYRAEDGQIAFRLVGTGHEPIPKDFDPENGTIANAIVTCPLSFCRHTIDAPETHSLFENGEAGERLLVVVTQHPKVTGKAYRLATESDIDVFNIAKSRLSEKQETLAEVWRLSPVPNEETPGNEVIGFGVGHYNLETYGALFNSRQRLCLLTMTEKIKNSYVSMLSHGYEADYTQAIVTYLGLWFDAIALQLANLCRWRNDTESVVEMFSKQAMEMIWDYGEANPLRIASNKLKTLLRPMTHLCQMDVNPVTIQQASATDLPYDDNTFDAVLTDPPYYDNVPYAYLSDFFYVWLNRSIGELYPDLFKADLTPKGKEIVAYSHRKGGKQAGKKFFEDHLAKAFQDIRRVLKPNGIAVIVYAHKSTEGWETAMNALLDSGLVITATWPIDTEMTSRMRALESAVLASSIYIIARKREQEPVGIYEEVKQELAIHLDRKLFELWEYGFSGANLFIGAIGLGIEVFGKYETVIDAEDNVIRADRMIDDIRELLERFDGQQAGVGATKLTRFYLRWRRDYKDGLVQFNDARELAMSVGIELTDEWGEGSFIQQVKGANVRVLGPQDRDSTDVVDSKELIDVLHHALILWSSGNRDEMIELLAEDSVGLNELIWNVSEQIRDALPTENTERQWLDGWLADRDAIQREIRKLVENS